MRSARATLLSCKAGPACCSSIPGYTATKWSALADDLRELGQSVVAGFSTHPHWDHLLWHARFGAVPRYGTARCAAAVRVQLSGAEWQARVATLIPPDIARQVPMDLFGLITGLPADDTRIPWDGPQVRVVEHQAHAPGHAALLIEERGVLVAGDMLSDILIPMLDLERRRPDRGLPRRAAAVRGRGGRR